MKKISYKDIEDYLDGEKTSNRSKELEEDKKFTETNDLFSLLERLPIAQVPSGFERNLYSRLGIFYFPLYRKVLILAGLSLFSVLSYFSGRASLHFATSRFNVTALSQFFSQVCAKWGQLVSIIRVGQHLKDILIAFTNPWYVFALGFLSSILMLILVGLLGKVRKGKVILISF